jgi:metal-sulfur cluster biosynthetic enzyme
VIAVPTVNEVFEALKPVMDPEHPVSITDPRMGIVKTEYIRADDELVQVSFKPTVPYCPMGGLIGILIRHQLETSFPKSTIQVKLLPGSHSMESDVNAMISDDEKYANIVAQLKERDMI